MGTGLVRTAGGAASLPPHPHPILQSVPFWQSDLSHSPYTVDRKGKNVYIFLFFFSILSVEQAFGSTKRVQEHQTHPRLSEGLGKVAHVPVSAVSSQLEIQAMGAADTGLKRLGAGLALGYFSSLFFPVFTAISAN